MLLGKTMSDIEHYLECDECHKMIRLEDVHLEPQIVSKDNSKGQKVVAVRYYFICPHCGYNYTCFYKDMTCNKLFDLNRQPEAEERMKQLWEFFENGS